MQLTKASKYTYKTTNTNTSRNTQTVWLGHVSQPQKLMSGVCNSPDALPGADQQHRSTEGRERY